MNMRTFVTADTHAEHLNIVTIFKSEVDPNAKARPWYTLDDMHDELVYRHNQVVRPQDMVYFLGDVALHAKGVDLFSRFAGRKVLIAGNHDCYATHKYLEHFEQVLGCAVLRRVLLSHMPVHSSQLRAHGGRYRFNIHGHLHSQYVQLPCGKPDPSYECVSVERYDYAPVPLDTVIDNLTERWQATVKTDMQFADKE